MSLLQELTPMTPEVNHALLSAEGEIMPGLVGTGGITELQERDRRKRNLKRHKERQLMHLLDCVPKVGEFIARDVQSNMCKSTVNTYLTKAVEFGFLEREKRFNVRAYTYFYRWVR